MAFSTVAKLGAGTVLSFEDPDGSSGVYIDLPNALLLGNVGEQGEFVETTPISQTVREYIAGLETPPNKTITFNDIPGNTDYENFMDAVRARETINMKVTYTNGRIADFTLVMAGSLMLEPQGNQQLRMQVFAQQSGATTWSGGA